MSSQGWGNSRASAGIRLFCAGACALGLAGCSKNLQSLYSANWKPVSADPDVTGSASTGAGRIRISDGGLLGPKTVQVAYRDTAGTARSKTGDYLEDPFLVEATPVPVAQRVAPKAERSVATKTNRPSQNAQSVGAREDSRSQGPVRVVGQREPEFAQNLEESQKSVSRPTSDRATSTAGRTTSKTTRKPVQNPIPGEAAVASNAERQRADRLMDRARSALRRGYREEALRLATAAEQIEFSGKARYRRDEERPSDVVTALINADPRLLEKWAANGSKATVAGTTGRGNLVEMLPAPNTPGGSRRGLNGQRLAGKVENGHSITIRPATSSGQAGKTPAVRPSGSSVAQVLANSGQHQVPYSQDSGSGRQEVVTALASPVVADQRPRASQRRLVVMADRIEDEEGLEPAPVPPLLFSPGAKSGSNSRIGRRHLATAALEQSDNLPEPASLAASSGKSRLGLASLVGLLAGLAGLFGLTYWKRREELRLPVGFVR